MTDAGPSVATTPRSSPSDRASWTARTGPLAARLSRLTATLRFITSHPLTRRRPASAIRRFVDWQIRSRLQREVPIEWVGGSRLLVRRGMTGATGNIYCGLHEFADMAFLLHLLRPGDLFVDVGANVGSYTILASKVCGASTIAFEPDPGAAEHLRRNVAANGVGALVTVHETALGSQDGTTYLSTGLDTMNRVSPAGGEGTRGVRLRRLDDVGGLDRPVLMKLDVEGFEEPVLEGGSSALAAPSLLAILSEMQGEAIDRRLAQFGFSRVYYDAFRRELDSRPVGDRGANALFVRRIEEVRSRISDAPRRKVLGVEL